MAIGPMILKNGVVISLEEIVLSSFCEISINEAITFSFIFSFTQHYSGKPVITFYTAYYLVHGCSKTR